MTLPASGPLTFTDIQTEFGGTNPIALNEYYAGGTYVPAATSGTYGPVPSSGQISVQNFYGTSAVIPVYIEEVFSTWLYTGTGATQTITNGIDLSTKGGLTWCKARSNPYDHYLFDTARGANNYLISNGTGAQNAYGTYSNLLTSFNTTGFSLGADSLGSINVNNVTYASWTFREQAKFFDIVTYTGNATDRTVAHNLGSVPGCIIVKDTNVGGNWFVYHRGASASPQNVELRLNSTNGINTNATAWNNTAPTSTVFSLGTGSTNTNGVTYIAYLFAHDAGGFGAAGTDNVISCGSFTTDGSGQATVSLGYEPQWIIMKATAGSESWQMYDTMRGWSVRTSGAQELDANSSSAEAANNAGWPTATGFFAQGQSASRTYIYIAIRRGPMKVPTVGTTVYQAINRTGTGATASVTGVGFPPDWVISSARSNGYGTAIYDRLRGANLFVQPSGTAAEINDTNGLMAFGMSGITVGADTAQGYINASGGINYINWNFGRAPSFFDEVCYTGTGSSQNVTHNLTVAPELVLIKSRSNGGSGYGWVVGSSTLPSWGRYLQLNTTDAVNGSNNAGPFNNTAPTSSVFTVNTWSETNNSGSTYVAYLFATCAGVSKVGTYTGNGSTQTINCSFTTGARFVLIKRTDAAGAWYVYDTVRGMTVLTDPYYLLNSTAGEVATLGSVTTVSTGFALNSSILAAINISAGTYIFLAIA